MDKATVMGAAMAENVVIAASDRRVDWTRGMARRLLQRQVPDAAAAFELVDRDASDAVAAGAPAAELRAWQLLVADLAGALRPIDGSLAEDARLLAGRLRSQVGLVSRNPADRLATRPASRRVLQALLDLGGRDALPAIRARSAMGQTHLSNIVKALAAHAFITLEADPADGRSKLATLTAKGRQAIGRAETRSRGRATFRTYVVDSERRPKALHSDHAHSNFHSDLRVLERS